VLNLLSKSHNSLSNSHRQTVTSNRRRNNNFRPFWLPATSYYFLTLTVAFIFFLIIGGILTEGGDETPWIPAGIISGFIVILSIFLREILLRKTRNKYLEVQQQLDQTLNRIPRTAKRKRKRKKFTLQQNSFMLNQIQEKSDAARILKRVPEGHFEVFEICNDYLNITKKEIRRIDINSPRFGAVKKGRKRVMKLHKYHLLTWAEIESKIFTLESKNKNSVKKKVELARKALSILDYASKFYPNDVNLSVSIEAIDEYIARMKMSKRLETAEQTAKKGDLESAISQYKDIIFLITTENFGKREKNLLINNVRNEINNLKKININRQNELNENVPITIEND
jgi:hypothetical protein